MESAANSSAKPDFEFKNWAQTVRSRPDVYYEPSTAQEVQEIVKKCLQSTGVKQVLRVVGIGHSPNGICVHGMEKEWAGQDREAVLHMVSLLKNMCQVLEVNEEKRTITI